VPSKGSRVRGVKVRKRMGDRDEAREADEGEAGRRRR